MCYAVPGKVVSVEGENALVDYDGVRKSANVSLLDNVSVGDFVLVHAGFAIERVPSKKAAESLEVFRGL